MVSSHGRELLAAAGLVALAIAFRTFWHIGPNIEMVTAATLVAAVFLRKRYAIIVPIAIMVLSDMIIGNTLILVFTWSAFILAGLLGRYLKQWEGIQLIAAGTGMGVVSTLFFYLWTNFGVWVLGWYPPTAEGLLASYVMAIPFLLPHLISNLVFVPAMFAMAITAKALMPVIVPSKTHHVA